jgi:hypothetical protein
MSEYPSQAALRRAVGVSKASISRYTGRWDWPVSRVPPWSDADVKTIQQWRQNLRENRAAADDFTGTLEREAPAPDAGPVSGLDLYSNPRSPFFALPWWGKTLFDEVTPADFQHLAAELNKWIRASTDAGDDDEALVGALGLLTQVWLARRFIGERWWKRLPTPSPDPPDDFMAMVARLGPLPHRTVPAKNSVENLPPSSPLPHRTVPAPRSRC